MIGTHIAKKNGFLGTISSFFKAEPKSKPIQIFTGSPKFWKRPQVSKEESEQIKEFVVKHNLNVFVHSIYLINLSWDKDKFNEKAADCLKWELINGKNMGFKGVVVHCGKYCKMDKETALNNMYNNLIDILKIVDPVCPLLLETSSGQGTELCFKYDDFRDFYRRIEPNLKDKLKVCIDTCHIFAAGNEPFKFIKDWELEFPKSLVLVHFNDSKGCLGCRKDRHEVPGLGEIGKEKMNEISEYCILNNIPLVIE